MKDREVDLVILDETGHHQERTMLKTLVKEKVMAPWRTVLVNGESCKTWDDVLTACERTPREEMPVVASLLQVVGG